MVKAFILSLFSICYEIGPNVASELRDLGGQEKCSGPARRQIFPTMDAGWPEAACLCRGQ